jgi:hypothetical protein
MFVTRVVSGTKLVVTYHARPRWGFELATRFWSSYYTVGYGAVMDPGYTTVNDVVTLETNFYDASREKDALVYSGESATWTDQSQSGSKIDSVISAVVYAMRAKRVL